MIYKFRRLSNDSPLNLTCLAACRTIRAASRSNHAESDHGFGDTDTFIEIEMIDTTIFDDWVYAEDTMIWDWGGHAGADTLSIKFTGSSLFNSFSGSGPWIRTSLGGTAGGISQSIT